MSGPETLSLEDFLSETGPVAARLARNAQSSSSPLHYESRPQQVAMANAVEQAFDNMSHLLVEAGTGVGKSFAYLIPAVRRVLTHGQRVVISTNTIALQEQLVHKDIPFLQQVFADLMPEASQDTQPFRAELVKGRGNYVSIRRLELASRKQDKLFQDEASRRSLHVIEDWAYRTKEGTLSSLPPLERQTVWDHVQSDTGNCMGRKCPRNEQCFFQNARRAAERADILVCNHALFFSDLALRTRGVGFLPTYDHVVLDEAHTVEDVASDHFGISLTEGRVNHLLNTLANRRTGKGALAVGMPLDSDDGPAMVEQAIRAAMECHDASRLFFEQVVRAAGGRDSSRRLREGDFIDNVLSPAFARLASRLKSLQAAAKAEEDKFELMSYAARAQGICDEADALCEQTVDGCVYWAEGKRTTSQAVRGTLACSPIEVAPVLENTLFAGEHSTVLCSATLTTGREKFTHFTSRMGCEDAQTLALGSPFDHAANVEVHVEAGMPDPRDASYMPELCHAIMKHVSATDGGAFILFTAFSTLRAAARQLRSQLEGMGIGVMVQDSSGSRSQLIEDFKRSERNVLFGTASFWQGVDVPGRALRNVIIARLPFEPPDRPLTQARGELIEQRGKSSFMEDQLPRAVVRFKQGVGRLIRSATDEGRVVVLDGRVATKRYGKTFLSALPQGVHVVTHDSLPSQHEI